MILRNDRGINEFWISKMTDSEVDDILAQLPGPRDRHVFAHAYNCQCLYPRNRPPAINVGVRRLQLFRRLGLVTKRPGQEKVTVEEADHILTDVGLELGKVINQRFRLALAVPPL